MKLFRVFLYKKVIFASYLIALFFFISYLLTPNQIIEEDGYERTQVMGTLKDIVTSRFVAEQINELLNLENIPDALMISELAQFMKIPVDYFVLQRIDEENSALKKSWRNAMSFISGFTSGTADDVSSFSGAMMSEFTMVGDTRDFYTQTMHYMHDEEVDEFIYILSMVGIGTTVATVFSAGLAAPAKVGVSVLKIAKKTGNLSKSLLESLSKIVVEVVDLKKFKNTLKQTTYTDFGKLKREVAILLKTAKTDNMMAVFTDIKKISDATSMADTVKILKYADNTNDLKRLGQLSRDFGTNTRGVLTVLGKRALKVTKSVAKSAVKLIATLFALLYSLITSLIALIFFSLKRKNLNQFKESLVDGTRRITNQKVIPNMMTRPKI